MSCKWQFSSLAASSAALFWRRLAHRFTRGLVLLAFGLLGVVGLAQAQVTIDNPSGPIIHVYVSNVLNLQAQYLGGATEVYGGTPGDYGTFVVINGVLYGPATVLAGYSATPRTPFTPVSQTPVSGAGTHADPYTVITTVDAGTTGIRIEETTTYVIGNDFFDSSTKLINTGATDQTVLLYRAMDCYLGGVDFGYGYVTPGMVACTKNQDNVPPGLVEGLTFTPGPDVHYMEDFYNTIWAIIGSQQPFPDTISPAYLDNGAGVSWDLTIPTNDEVTVTSSTLFSPNGALPLTTDVSVTPSPVFAGAQVTYTVTVNNPNADDVQLSTLTDILPAGFSYLNNSTAGALSLNPTVTGQTLEWNASSVIVPANGSITFTFKANVAAGQAPGSYPTTVQAAATGYTVRPSSDVAPVSVIMMLGGPPPAPIPALSELALALLALVLMSGAATRMRRHRA